MPKEKRFCCQSSRSPPHQLVQVLNYCCGSETEPLLPSQLAVWRTGTIVAVDKKK